MDGPALIKCAANFEAASHPSTAIAAGTGAGELAAGVDMIIGSGQSAPLLSAAVLLSFALLLLALC